ncbi:SpoIIE family protein phosphatase [Streptomyces sp. NPDC001380]|uniref:SpoIIE family protein phosphatase n=1 Tax=Streptomyces sp. NPDC001380 TaxID=3364566 RepID=UPI0036910ABB
MLVVDDNAVKRYVLTTWLRRAGHRVVEAGDGEEGLRAAWQDGPDAPEVAVVDVRLPDLSGFQVCERLKADPRTAGVPVIHVSATAIAVTDRTQGLDRGADAYLAEPIDPQELLATVAAVLRYARARRRAEDLAARVTALNRITLDVYSAPAARPLAAAAAAGAAVLLGQPAAAVLLTPQEEALCTVAPTPGALTLPAPAAADAHARLGDLVLGSATGARTATVPEEVWRPLLPGAPMDGELLVAAARTKRDRPPLCLAVQADTARSSDDRNLLIQLAHACALSLEALRAYSEEHSLALTLQRTFLPSRLPRVPGLELAVRYRPAAEQTEIGGDFYEAVETSGGLLLAIGDVAGHSLSAATVMGEVRHALRAYAMEGHPPEAVLERLDTFLVRSRPGVTVTVCLVLVSPDRREVRVSNAGHIPPLLIGPDGAGGYLRPHSPLLGLGLPHPPAVPYPVAAGSRLLLVTDGLVEERRTDLDERLAAFATAASAGPEDLELLCDLMLARFGEGNDDDIAILAARLD